MNVFFFFSYEKSAIAYWTINFSEKIYRIILALIFVLCLNKSQMFTYSLKKSVFNVFSYSYANLLYLYE